MEKPDEEGFHSRDEVRPDGSRAEVCGVHILDVSDGCLGSRMCYVLPQAPTNIIRPASVKGGVTAIGTRVRVQQVHTPDTVRNARHLLAAQQHRTNPV